MAELRVELGTGKAKLLDRRPFDAAKFWAAVRRLSTVAPVEGKEEKPDLGKLLAAQLVPCPVPLPQAGNEAWACQMPALFTGALRIDLLDPDVVVEDRIRGRTMRSAFTIPVTFKLPTARHLTLM